MAPEGAYTKSRWVTTVALALVLSAVVINARLPKAGITQEGFSEARLLDSPEASIRPGSLLLVGSGLLMLGGVLRSRRQPNSTRYSTSEKQEEPKIRFLEENSP